MGDAADVGKNKALKFVVNLLRSKREVDGKRSLLRPEEKGTKLILSWKRKCQVDGVLERGSRRDDIPPILASHGRGEPGPGSLHRAAGNVNSVSELCNRVKLVEGRLVTDSAFKVELGFEEGKDHQDDLWQELSSRARLEKSLQVY